MNNDTSRRLAVITDQDGNVVGAHHVGAASSADTAGLAETAGMGMLPGQHAHEVDLPEALIGTDRHEVLLAVTGYRVVAGALVPRKG